MDNQIRPVFESRECDKCGLTKRACEDMYGTSRFIQVGTATWCVNCVENWIATIFQAAITLRNEVLCLSPRNQSI